MASTMATSRNCPTPVSLARMKAASSPSVAMSPGTVSPMAGPTRMGCSSSSPVAAMMPPMAWPIRSYAGQVA